MTRSGQTRAVRSHWQNVAAGALSGLPSAFQSKSIKYEKEVVFVEKQFFSGSQASKLSTVTATVLFEIIIQGSKPGLPPFCRNFAQK
jgi:hypothetical protein